MTARRQNLLFVLAMVVAVDALYALGLLGTAARVESSPLAELGRGLESWLPFYLVVHVVALFVLAIAWMSAEDVEVGRIEQLDRIETSARERRQA